MIDPHGLLAKVHPDLVKVVMATGDALPGRFQVVQGLRTEAQEQSAVCSGHSTTMHSRHLPDAQGLACAIDFAVLNPNGTINWGGPTPSIWYMPIARKMIELSPGILGDKGPVEWGGDWLTFKDWGHIQLPWSTYP